MGKIPRPSVPYRSDHIPKPPIKVDGILKFSFNILDLTSNSKFGIHQCKGYFLIHFLLSGLTPITNYTYRK